MKRSNTISTSINPTVSSTLINTESNTLFLDFTLNSYRIYLNQNQILTDLKGKSGVYCWINRLNGNYYIASTVILSLRISDYYQPHYYKDPKQLNLLIVRAVLKYGLGNFSFAALSLKAFREERVSLEITNPE